MTSKKLSAEMKVQMWCLGQELLHEVITRKEYSERGAKLFQKDTQMTDKKKRALIPTTLKASLQVVYNLAMTGFLASPAAPEAQIKAMNEVREFFRLEGENVRGEEKK